MAYADQLPQQIVADGSVPKAAQNKAVFRSKELSMDLRYIIEETEGVERPNVEFKELDLRQKVLSAHKPVAMLHMLTDAT